MKTSVDASKLVDRVAALVEAAKKAGADAADAVAVRGRSSSVSVRLGKVEATESLGERRHFAARLRRQAGRQRLGDRGLRRRRCSPSAPSRWPGVAGGSVSGPRRPGAARHDDPRSRPLRRHRDCRRAAEGGRACGRRGRACRSRASPIPAAAAPAPGWAGWCSPPRTASSASMSARASRARPASSPARARRWSATTTFPRACISPISTRPRRSAARPASARSAASTRARRGPDR